MDMVDYIKRDDAMGVAFILGVTEMHRHYIRSIPSAIVHCCECVHGRYDTSLFGYRCANEFQMRLHSGAWFCADGKRATKDEHNDK